MIEFKYFDIESKKEIHKNCFKISILSQEETEIWSVVTQDEDYAKNFFIWWDIASDLSLQDYDSKISIKEFNKAICYIYSLKEKTIDNFLYVKDKISIEEVICRFDYNNLDFSNIKIDIYCSLQISYFDENGTEYILKLKR